MSKKKVYCKNCKFGEVFVLKLGQHLQYSGGGFTGSKMIAPIKHNKYTGILESPSVLCFPKEENSNGECVYYEEKG